MSDTNDEHGRGDAPTDPTAPPEDSDWPPPADGGQPAYGADPSYGQQPPPQPPPHGAPPPYGAPPPPYGAPPPGYGAAPAHGAPPAHGIPAYGEVGPYGPPQPYEQPPGMGDGYAPWPYGPPGTYGVPRRNGSALALTITSGVLSVFCCSILTLPALVMGIVALARQSSDPAGSARWTRYGWIAFGVGILVTLAVLGVLFALSLSGVFDDSYYYEGVLNSAARTG